MKPRLVHIISAASLICFVLREKQKIPSLPQGGDANGEELQGKPELRVLYWPTRSNRGRVHQVAATAAYANQAFAIGRPQFHLEVTNPRTQTLVCRPRLRAPKRRNRGPALPSGEQNLCALLSSLRREFFGGMVITVVTHGSICKIESVDTLCAGWCSNSSVVFQFSIGALPCQSL